MHVHGGSSPPSASMDCAACIMPRSSGCEKPRSCQQCAGPASCCSRGTCVAMRTRTTSSGCVTCTTPSQHQRQQGWHCRRGGYRGGGDGCHRTTHQALPHPPPEAACSEVDAPRHAGDMHFTMATPRSRRTQGHKGPLVAHVRDVALVQVVAAKLEHAPRQSQLRRVQTACTPLACAAEYGPTRTMFAELERHSWLIP